MDEVLEFVLDISKKAGRAILEVYNSDFAIKSKEDKTPLTLADKRSHEIIAEFLNEKYPFPTLSEEGRVVSYEERKGWEYFWLVDPLDGTKEFIKRNGEFTVNIALVYKDRPVLGVIYIPVKDTLYYALRGEGAYIVENGKKIKLPIENLREKFTIVGSRSHATQELEEFVEGMKDKYGDVEFIAAGSSLKFCLVAEGRADIYPRFGPTMEWDTAAGQMILEEASGKVVEFESGKPLKYNKENLLNPWFVAFLRLN